MANTTRRNNRNRRRGMSGNQKLLQGTTKSQKFNTITSHQTITTSSAGLNTTTFTYNNLAGSDLPSNRLVRLRAVTMRVHPYNQATTSGAHFSVQLAWNDPSTSSVSTPPLPITLDKPLSSTNVTNFRARIPLTTSWISATSTVPVLTVNAWAQAALASGVIADIFCVFDVAQDLLS